MSRILLWIVLVLSLLGEAQCGLPVTKRKKMGTNPDLHENQDASLDPDDFLSSFLSSFTKSEEPESPLVLVSPYTTVSDHIPVPDSKVQDIQPRADIVTTFGTIVATAVLGFGRAITTLFVLILKKKLFIAAIIIAVLASFGLTGSGGEDLVNVVAEADRIQRKGGVGVGDQIRKLVGNEVEVSALLGDVDGLESYLSQGFKVLRRAVGLVATSVPLKEDVNYLTPSLSTATLEISAADETYQEVGSKEVLNVEREKKEVSDEEVQLDIDNQVKTVEISAADETYQEVGSKEVLNVEKEKKEVSDEEVQLDIDNQVKTVDSDLQGTLGNKVLKEAEPIFHDVHENFPHEVDKTVNLGVVEGNTDTVLVVESGDEKTNPGAEDTRKVHDLVVANIFKGSDFEEKSIDLMKPSFVKESVEVTEPGLFINNQYQNLSDFDWLSDTDSNTLAVEDENQAKSIDVESSTSFGEGKGFLLKLLTPSVNSDHNSKDNPEIDVNQEIEGVTAGYKELLTTLRSVELEFLSPATVEAEVMINQVETEKLSE